MATPGSVKQLYIALAHLIYVETQMARDLLRPFKVSDEAELLAQADRVVELGKELRQQNPAALNEDKLHDAKNKVSRAQLYFYEINNSQQSDLSRDDVFNAVFEVIAALADVLGDAPLGHASHPLIKLEGMHDEAGNKDVSGAAAIGVDKLLH